MKKWSLVVCCASLIGAALAQQPKAASPADGYTIHVSAPHMVDGKIMGPYHHYCKVMQPDPPKIVCLIFDSTEPNAMLQQVEFIWAKSLVRSKVPLATWNKYWHDHQIEIATGRVKVHDMSDADAKNVADLVATTDGYIIHIPFDQELPEAGKISFPQAVGHKKMTAAEYKGTTEKAIKKEQKKP